jgi:hypothetical protein
LSRWFQLSGGRHFRAVSPPSELTVYPEAMRETDVNTYAVASSVALDGLVFYVGETFPSLQHFLRAAGYAGTFVLGILYVYSFTSLPAAALLFIIAKRQNIWVAGTMATVGGDLELFGLFRSAKRFSDDQGPHLEPYAGWWKVVETRIQPRGNRSR